MTKSKHEKERQWNVRKEDQKPHGKVPHSKSYRSRIKENNKGGGSRPLPFYCIYC